MMRSQSRNGRRDSHRDCVGAAFAMILFLAIAPGARAQPQHDFDSVAIDALDPDAWNGVVFLATAFQQPAHFALRLGSRGSTYLVGKDLFNAVREVGPHAPDSSYCRL